MRNRSQPGNIFRISSAAHTNVQRVYSREKRKQLIQERKRANKVVESTSEIYGWNDNILIIFRMKIAWIEQNGHTLKHIHLGEKIRWPAIFTHKCAFTISVHGVCILERWVYFLLVICNEKMCLLRSTWAKHHNYKSHWANTHRRFVTCILSANAHNMKQRAL